MSSRSLSNRRRWQVPSVDTPMCRRQFLARIAPVVTMELKPVFQPTVPG
jgi:hypothetical protein